MESFSPRTWSTRCTSDNHGPMSKAHLQGRRGAANPRTPLDTSQSMTVAIEVSSLNGAATSNAATPSPNPNATVTATARESLVSLRITTP